VVPVYWGRKQEYPVKTFDLWQVTRKHFHMRFHQEHPAIVKLGYPVKTFDLQQVIHKMFIHAKGYIKEGAIMVVIVW